MAVPVVGSARGRRRPPLAEINVTPLVDVMLVLLIISMVAAPMLQEGIPLELPKSESASPIERRTSGLVDRDGPPHQRQPVHLDLLGERMKCWPEPPRRDCFLRGDRRFPTVSAGHDRNQADQGGAGHGPMRRIAAVERAHRPVPALAATPLSDLGIAHVRSSGWAFAPTRTTPSVQGDAMTVGLVAAPSSGRRPTVTPPAFQPPAPKPEPPEPKGPRSSPSPSLTKKPKEKKEEAEAGEKPGGAPAPP
jgi:biopolymer transport protein ExbD